MAISVVGTPQSGVKTDGTDVSLSPGACAVGDVLIVWGGTFNRAGITAGPTANLSNFTAWQDAYSYTAGNPLFRVAWCRCTTETTPTVTCKGSANAADGVAYCCYVLRGVNPTCLDANLTVTGVATAGPTGSTNPDSPSITTATDGAWVLSLAISTVSDASVTVPTNYLNKVGNNANASTNDYTVYGATFAVATAGAQDPGAWTNWATGTWIAASVAVSPAREGTDPVTSGLSGPGSVVLRLDGSDAVAVVAGSESWSKALANVTEKEASDPAVAGLGEVGDGGAIGPVQKEGSDPVAGAVVLAEMSAAPLVPVGGREFWRR